MSVRRQCQLIGLARAGLYRTPKLENARNLELIRLLDVLPLKNPAYVGSHREKRHLIVRNIRHLRLYESVKGNASVLRRLSGGFLHEELLTLKNACAQ